MQFLQNRTQLNTFSCFYFLIHFASHSSAIAALAYLGYRANFEMNEGFSQHKEKNILVITIHETFLILRYISWGLALIIGISLFYYLKIFFSDHMLFFVPVEEQRRLPNNFDVSSEDGNSASVMTVSKAALLRENNNPGYIFDRLPNSVPFRRLIFHEST